VTPARYALNTALTASKVFDDEVIAINVVTGRYYDLEGTAAVAWTMLAAGASAAEVTDAFCRRFDVEREVALRDVEGLVDSLLTEELIVPAEHALGPAEPSSAPSVRAPYAPPALATYSDMEDLLTVDPPMPAGYTPNFPASEPDEPRP
jgi:hypothetical protein